MTSSDSQPGDVLSERGALAKLFPRVVAVVGVSLGALYGVGFLVANSYYGTFWLVEPALLQARYAAAGVLWLVFLACSLVPAHYGIHWWGALKIAVQRAEASEQHRSERLPDRVLNWIAHRNVVLRWLLFVPFVLVFGAGAVFLVGFFVVLPSFVLMFLAGIGATFSAVLLPAALFHWAVLLMIVTARWGGMTLEDSFAFGKEPHRALTLVAGLCLHAVLFGKVVYPLVPPSGGGGQPLAIRITLTEPLQGVTGIVGGVDNGDGSTTFDGAYLVGESDAFLVTLLPKAPPDSTRRFYCPVAVRRESVALVQVRTPMIPMSPIPALRRPSRITDVFVPGPLVWDCR